MRNVRLAPVLLLICAAIACGVTRNLPRSEPVEPSADKGILILGVHPAHADLAGRLPRVVTGRATSVGSGTVVRTVAG